MLSSTIPLKKQGDPDADDDGPKLARVERVFDTRQAKNTSDRSRKQREHQSQENVAEAIKFEERPVHRPPPEMEPPNGY